jgi:hypothetical protein
MNVLRAISVVVVLLGSTVPIAGQERTAASPFSQAALRRAVTAPAAREVVPPAPESGQEPGDWSRVRRLSAGTNIVVTAVNLVAGPLEVLDADDASLTVLSTDGVTSSGRGSTIRGMATGDPRGLAAVARGRTLIQGDLRIAPEGVSIAGRKIMELRQLLVRIPRADVTEIRRMTGGRTGKRVAGGVVAGYFGCFGGALAGGLVGLMIGKAVGADPSNLGPIVVGGLSGGVIGSIFAFRKVAGPRVRDTLIYQAPDRPIIESAIGPTATTTP